MEDYYKHVSVHYILYNSKVVYNADSFTKKRVYNAAAATLKT